MKQITLTQGKVALIDDGDFEFLSGFKWFAVFDGYNWYAASKISCRSVKMHQLLMSVNGGSEIDHRDNNGLNNQRSNLRICTHRNNIRNKKIASRNKSGLKGVSWKPHISRWIAQIKTDDKVVHLGTFIKKEDAAMTYDAAAEKHFGEFACTNRKLGLLTYDGDPVSKRSPFRTSNTSGLLGVGLVNKTKWQVRLTVNGKRIRIGQFDDKQQAGRMYDKAAKKHLGKFALTNKKLGLL